MTDNQNDKRERGILAAIIGPKKRWREYKRRVKALPGPYRDAVAAVERYAMHFGVVEWRNAELLFENIVDLFEQAAADGTPIRSVVGDDPVAFVDALIANYDKGGYVAREQRRLVQAIDDAAGDSERD